jgi:hypothetical protein
MKDLFITPPKIEFCCICYHYETRKVTTYDSKGNASTRTETVQVVTRTASKFFNYYSSRDVFGLFNINYDESSIINKFYVKLELLVNIDFADTVTYSDYLKEKEEFCESNRHYDTFMDFIQKDIIDGLTSYNLIKITENDPCGISVFWYIIFTLMGIVQLYKVYVNSKCTYKSFTIRKLISSRFSLTTEECDNKYKKFDPAISFADERIKLTTNEFGHISQDFEQKIPTQEEIDSAKQYQDKIFSDSDNNKDEGPKIEYNINEENDTDNNSESNNNLEIGLIPK